MQTRPFPEKDGRRVWLSRPEQQRLRQVADDGSEQSLVVALGLHGLRVSETCSVTADGLRRLADGETSVIEVPRGNKTGTREVPISDDLATTLRVRTNAAGLDGDDEFVSVGTRQASRWLESLTDELADEKDDWRHVGTHDLRRTWATDTYYSLATSGNPIAESLVLSWGGWEQSETGRTTFNENYLGPVPDHVVSQAVKNL